MMQVLAVAWVLAKVFKYAGLAVALGGVVFFGKYFIRQNARAAQSENQPVAWGGAGAMTGLRIVVIGLAIQVAGFVFALCLPVRP